MLVILKEDIRALGRLGEIVKVKPGYARNFLFPQKKAVKATDESIAKLEEQRSSLEEENMRRLNLARKLAASLIGGFVVLVKQASEDGKIFGSITAREIAKSLSQECEVDHRRISFNGIKIRSLGEYQVDIELHTEVVVPITVHVVRSETDAHELRQVKLQSRELQQQESQSVEQEGINGK